MSTIEQAWEGGIISMQMILLARGSTQQTHQGWIKRNLSNNKNKKPIKGNKASTQSCENRFQKVQSQVTIIKQQHILKHKNPQGAKRHLAQSIEVKACNCQLEVTLVCWKSGTRKASHMSSDPCLGAVLKWICRATEKNQRKPWLKIEFLALPLTNVFARSGSMTQS